MQRWLSGRCADTRGGVERMELRFHCDFWVSPKPPLHFYFELFEQQRNQLTVSGKSWIRIYIHTFFHWRNYKLFLVSENFVSKILLEGGGGGPPGAIFCCLNPPTTRTGVFLRTHMSASLHLLCLYFSTPSTSEPSSSPPRVQFQNFPNFVKGCFKLRKCCYFVTDLLYVLVVVYNYHCDFFKTSKLHDM